VAHTYNPSYSGGRDQEEIRRDLAKQFVRTYLKKKTLSQKIGLTEWLKVKALRSTPVPQK
jgi:hypothetical protein